VRDGTEEAVTDIHQIRRMMRRGDFAGTWEVMDAMRRDAGAVYAHAPARGQWVWNGVPLAGRRVLIRCGRGLGDTLHFIRYAPLVRAAAVHVIVSAQPALLPLLRTMTGIEFVSLNDDVRQSAYDVDVDVMELAYLFRTTIETIPRDVPYLHVAPASIERDGRLAVGVVWRGRDWTTQRDVPFELIESLADVPGVSLISLQREPDRFSERIALVRGADEPLTTAQLMRAMDLVVTIDSMPAHLAGALGVRTWTLLQADADWRWIDGRDDSPWYPTMRLFRQERAGEWLPVIDRLRAELAAAAAVHNAIGYNSMNPETLQRQP
jgi:hypothetical protein